MSLPIVKPSVSAGKTQKATLVDVTPDMAAHWLDVMKYEHQRKVRSYWVDYLARECERGSFRQGTQIHIAHYNGHSMLIDGQHRLKAVVKSGKTQRFDVLETQIASEEDLGWAYGSTDIGLRRSSNDLYGALDLHTELDMTKSQVGAMHAAISFMRQGCLRQTHQVERAPRDEMVAGITLYAEYGKQFFNILQRADRSIVVGCMRAATLSLALLTLRYPVKNAPTPAEFWQGVVWDDGIRAKDPRKFVTRHLLTAGMPGGGSRDHSVTPWYSVRFLGYCYNHYINRNEITSPKVYNDMAPLASIVRGIPKDVSDWMK